MRRSFRCLMPLFVIVLCVSARSNGQGYLYGIGNQTWGVNIPVENGSINVGNGQIHLELPLATHAQRGSLALNETLVYDSRIWQIVANGSSYSFQPTNVPNSQAGWRFVAVNETGTIQVITQAENMDCYQGNPSGNQLAYYNYWFNWTDPSGAVHSFPVQTQQPVSGFCSGSSVQYVLPNTPSASGYAADGSGYSVSVTNYTNATVHDARGNQVYPIVADRNGNSYSTDANGNLVDTIGRTPILKSTSGNQTYYDVLTIGGARKRYTVTTQTINVHTAFGQSGVSDYSGSLTAIASIGLPDGTSYTLNYDSGTSSGNYGELQSITLPTGGTVYLSYANYLDSYQNQNRWLESYSGGNGSYTFTPSVVTQCTGSNKVGCQEKMTVQDGNGNQVVYLLTLNNGAWNSQMDYYNGSSTHIMSTATYYNFATSCTYYACNGAQWITASSVTTTLSDTGQTALTQYSYTYPATGQPNVVQQWDYYTGSPSSVPTKETDYVGMYPYFSQIKQLDSSGNIAAQASYTYDVSGNPSNIVSGIGTTVTTSSTYDGYGMKLTDTDGNSNTTNYSYACSDAYLTRTTLPVTTNGSSLQTTTSYDCSSGLVTATQDMNGVVTGKSTAYSYFTSGGNLGRLQTVSYPDTGSSTYSYPSATESDQVATQTASVNVTAKTILDGYGRPYQTIKSAPEGAITSETTYDATGRPYCVTTTHLQGTISSTDGTTCTSYDVLGRTTQTLMPDGNSATSSYSGPTQTVTDELQHSKQYTYDAFHRLTSVLEPNSSGTLAYETDYQYNALDKLVQVDQWGGAHGASSPGDRQRLFAYDSLGREIAENIPENQSAGTPAALTCSGTASGSKWTKCFGYDGNGNTTSTADNAGNSITYQYDALNRLRWQRLSNSTAYGYGYDGNNENGASMGMPASANVIGRMSHSSNEVNAAANYYYDSMGRLNQETYCVPLNCSYGIAVGAAYDLAGNRTSLTYPDGRVVSQSFDSANRFTGAQYAQWGSTSIGTPYYTVSSFAPPGQPRTASIGNGFGITAAFNSRQSIASLAYTNSGNTLWSKQFTWDRNAANLLLLTDNLTGNARQFGYDTLNRIASAVDVIPNPTTATATLTISGSEQSSYQGDPCQACHQYGCPPCPVYVYDQGSQSVSINGVFVGTIRWSQGSTSSALASSLVTSINATTNSPVTASASGSTVVLTSKIAGPTGDYGISVSSVSWSSNYFSSASFTISSPSSLSGGTAAGSPINGGLNETYNYDPFGNLTQSGNFGFSQSFNAFNQISGYSYDAAGDQNTDIYSHALAFDPNGLLSSVAGGAETYVYDPQGQRVEVHGSTVTDFIYFGGVPITMLSGGSYTDLIYAGGALIAEVGGTQSAVPVYRMTDNLGSLTGVNYAPYGQIFSGSTSDPFGFTGLQSDPTTALWHATFRQFSPQQGRWQSPDPYPGSYNWADPQSLNRYAYVNGRPMTLTDPSGQSAASIGCGSAIAQEGANIPNDALCIFLLAGGAWLDDHLFGWLFGTSSFHGSLKPRPNSKPWSERDPMTGITSLGTPMGGIGNPQGALGSINQALGLPSLGAGCEFGACGGIGSAYTAGENTLTLPLNICTQYPALCTISAEVVALFSRAVPIVAATGALLSMKGDRSPCAAEWAEARDYCSSLMSNPGRAPNVWGGSFDRCVRGQVSQRCGGNRVN